jgi:hypothetical protein
MFHPFLLLQCPLHPYGLLILAKFHSEQHKPCPVGPIPSIIKPQFLFSLFNELILLVITDSFRFVMKNGIFYFRYFPMGATQSPNHTPLPPPPSPRRKCEYGNPESLSRIFPHQTGGGRGGREQQKYIFAFTRENLGYVHFRHW